MGYIFLVPGSVITYALQLHGDPELYRCSDIDLKVEKKRAGDITSNKSKAKKDENIKASNIMRNPWSGIQKNMRFTLLLWSLVSHSTIKPLPSVSVSSQREIFEGQCLLRLKAGPNVGY